MQTTWIRALLVAGSLMAAPGLAHAQVAASPPPADSVTSTAPDAAASAAPAESPVVPEAQQPPPPPTPRPRPGRFMVHANLALNVFTWMPSYVNPAGATVAEYWAYPGHRTILQQQIGAGYWIHPNVRLQLTFQFAEFLDNVPGAGTANERSALSLMGVIPWVVFTKGIFFAGAGALIAWWAYGRPAFAAGVFTSVGISVPVGSGWALGAAVQAPFLWGERFSLAVSPAVFVARRF